MTPLSHDSELVTAFATEGSEAAFHALVARHVNLVYATALRQVGDTGMAEEITQNVFIALATKSPRLGGRETLAGWLHRSAILEAKARVRSELRRQRREATAAEVAALEREGASPLASLMPLLDEALLKLRDSDRLALVLRFLEERSLHEVGVVLGVDEDAARKRVSRALDRLAAFFQRRGFAVSTGGGCAAVLAGAPQAAPAGLAVSAAQAGLAAGGASAGFNLVLLQLMTLSKLQTAIVCALIAAAPLTWQWRAEARLSRDQTAINSQLAALTRRANELDGEILRTRESTRRLRADAWNAEIRLAAINAQREGKAPRPQYRWDDQSPVARVPKKMLEALPVSAVANRRGQLSEHIKEMLQLTDAETQSTQAALDRFTTDLQAAQGRTLDLAQPTARELEGRPAEETRVFEIADTSEEFREFRQRLFEELGTALGTERFPILKNTLPPWMPVDDEYHGLSGARVIFSKAHRVRFHQPQPGDRTLSFALYEGNSSIGLPMPLAEIPDLFRPHLEDWITLAQSPPSKEPSAAR